jgi:tetratricopeptide (TPR) repeat protein
VGEHARALADLGREYGFAWYAACGELFACWARAMALDEDAGAAEAATLERIYQTGVAPDGNLIFHSQFCRMIAELLHDKARYAEAQSWAERGIAVSVEHQEAIYLAELQRIRGLALAKLGHTAEALAALRGAQPVAAGAGQRLFELRIQLSLCELQGSPDDAARTELAALAEGFPATADNADLQAARALLA